MPVDTAMPLDRRNSPRERPPPSWESLRPVPVDWEMEPPSEATPAAPRIPPRAPPRPRPRAAIPTPADLEIDMAVEAVEVHRVRAPAWRRIASWAVDGALLGAAAAAMLLPVLGPVLGPGGLEQARDVLAPTVLAVALLAFAYQWLGITLTGATPGMGAAGLRCVGPDGHRPSPGRSAVRSALGLFSAAALGTGLLLALFTRSGRGAHDLGAGTWVVLAAPAGKGA